MRMKVPDFSKVYTVEFPKLDGGLNLRELGYVMGNNESPYMRNMAWRNGLLQSRDGQRKVAELSHAFDTSDYHICYAVSEEPFHGYVFFHVGDTIQCIADGYELTEPEGTAVHRANVLTNGITPGKGTFLPYQDKLYYKNRGGFYVISYADPENPDSGGTDGGDIRADFRVYRESPALAAQTYDIFKLNGDKYVKISCWDDIPLSSVTGWESERYIVRCNAPTEKDGFGRLLSAETLPKCDVVDDVSVPEPDYDKSFVALDTEEQPANSVWTGAVFSIERPRDGSNRIHLHPVSDTTVCVGVKPGRTTLSYSDEDDLYYKWLLRDPQYQAWEDWDHGAPFRLVNLGLFRETGADYSAYYRPQAVLDAAPFVVRNLAEVADEVDNAPVIVINADPSTGSGTMYQPENRMSYNKTVWYNADGETTVYHLPVKNILSVKKVKVGTSVLTSGFTVNKTAGTVTFDEAPNPGDPPANNTVQITYRKANKDARWAVIDCPYMTVASGGDAAQFLIVGGCEQQPDAIFWNANDELAIEPWYFPMPCYNLMGTAGDPVTGFGRQYDDTLVFSEHSTGKLTYDTQTVEGRVYPAFRYSRVNAKIGCDLPWTIQQVQNNVVFCNTYTGVHIVLSSSAAYENNIQELSRKIWDAEGSYTEEIKGLQYDIQNSDLPVLGFDDGERYWLYANSHVFVWDYSISTYANPSWFFWTNITTRGLFFDWQRNVYNMDSNGNILAFKHVNNDQGNPIYKVYRFPTQLLGGLERLKNVTQLLIATRADVDSTVNLKYRAEGEPETGRYDRTPLRTEYDADSAARQKPFRQVAVFRRTPGCRNIRQFSLTLGNNVVDEDLAPVSVQIFYRFTGKER